MSSGARELARKSDAQGRQLLVAAIAVGAVGIGVGHDMHPRTALTDVVRVGSPTWSHRGMSQLQRDWGSLACGPAAAIAPWTTTAGPPPDTPATPEPRPTAIAWYGRPPGHQGRQAGGRSR